MRRNQAFSALHGNVQEVFIMAKTYVKSLKNFMALALLVGTGLPVLANAQPIHGTPPTPDASPQFQEPPPLHRPETSRAREPTLDQINPLSPEEPAMGWLPPGGSLQVRDYQGIRYVSGGIGLSGREELNALSPQFNLRLMFAIHGTGSFLADVGVRILDSGGAVVLDAKSEGPHFLAQLPPGRYTVEASARDQTQRQTAQVGARQTRLNFFWR
jgi:hypothetical protein